MQDLVTIETPTLICYASGLKSLRLSERVQAGQRATVTSQTDRYQSVQIGRDGPQSWWLAPPSRTERSTEGTLAQVCAAAQAILPRGHVLVELPGTHTALSLVGLHVQGLGVACTQWSDLSELDAPGQVAVTVTTIDRHGAERAEDLIRSGGDWYSRGRRLRLAGARTCLSAICAALGPLESDDVFFVEADR